MWYLTFIWIHSVIIITKNGIRLWTVMYTWHLCLVLFTYHYSESIFSISWSRLDSCFSLAWVLYRLGVNILFYGQYLILGAKLIYTFPHFKQYWNPVCAYVCVCVRAYVFVYIPRFLQARLLKENFWVKEYVIFKFW